MSAFTPEQRRELAGLLRGFLGNARCIDEWAKEAPAPPAGNLVAELKGWTTGSEATDDACRMVWLMHKAAASPFAGGRK